MEVKIINKSHHPLPGYATPLSAGMDIRANLTEPVVLKPLERKLIPTGLYIALPEGYEAQMRPRSGLALKHGITLLNTPGTIDADYRGEIGVIIINHGTEPFTIERGMRIAQAVLAPVVRAAWRDGKLSLGALDPVLKEFTGQPPRPDSRAPVVIVEDGRARQ